MLTFNFQIPFDFNSVNYRINITQIEKIIPNKELIEVLKIIEDNFPLSLIEKQQVLTKLQTLSVAFWLADSAGNISIANKNVEFFSPVTSVSGNSEKNVFYNSVCKEINTLNNLIRETKSLVISENFKFEKNENIFYRIIKFPILNSKNEIVASCGIIQPGEVISIFDKEINYIINAFEKLPIPAAIFDTDTRLLNFTNEFSEYFPVNSLTSSVNISDIFPKEFVSEINDFLILEDSNEKQAELNIVIDGEKRKIPIKILKIYNSKSVFIASLFIFEERNNKNFSIISVLDMLNEILNSTPYPAFVYDEENLKFLLVNEAAVNFYGYSKDKFLQMDLTDLYLPKDIQSLIEFEPGENSQMEKPVRHKLSNGEIAVVQLKRKPLEFNGRKAILTFVKDITTEPEINDSIRKLKLLVDVVDEAIIETDMDGFILKVNSSVAKHLGYDINELQGKTFISLLSENDRAKINKKIFINRVTENIEEEITVKTKNGKSFIAKVFAIPLFDIFEELSGYSLILKISENISQNKVKQNVTVERNVNSSIDVDFLSHLFHEILTPINVIIGFTQELLESIKNPTPEQKESAQIISENQQSLMQLIDAATEYAAIEQNRTRIKPEEFGFVEVLDKIEENVKKIAKAYNVELKYGKISSSIILFQDKHLFVMFISLFWEFAIRATKEGQVYLSAQKENDKVIITVKDLKNEISENLLRAMNEYLSEDEALVRRNYNVSRFSVRLYRKLSTILNVEFKEIEKNGNIKGFGLSIPKNIETSSGSVSVGKIEKKVVEKKSTVQTKNIEINETDGVKPNVKNRNMAVNKIIKNNVNSISKRNNEIDLSRYSCLLLEDQLDSQLLFKQQMKELREIEAFARFEDALPILRKKKFDFVVMDINLLGDYNGLEALHEIRNIPEYKNIPVIASTAYMMPGDQDRYLEAGFDAFISKPILKDKLIDTLKNLL